MIFLFESIHFVMRAEAELRAAHIPYELLPVPKERSAECGMCIRVAPASLDAARRAIFAQVASVVEDDDDGTPR